MTRVGFLLQVQPELLDEYIARHAPIWPEMLAEIVHLEDQLAVAGDPQAHPQTTDSTKARP